MKTAVIYARYSSDSQTEQSIEGQLRVCNEYAHNNNIVVVDTYVDRAMTGTNDNRPNFKQMISDSKNKNWNYVLVYKLDRFSRNKYEAVIHKKTLKDNGVKLLSAMENIPDTPEGIILESMLEGMNQYFSAELAQKVARGMKETRRKGYFQGGQILYGYKVDGRKIVIDESQAEIVRYAFTQYSIGVSIKDNLNELKRRGVTRNGKCLNYSMLYKVLFNEKYSGTYKHGDEIIDNMYPQIIEPQLYKKVREKIDSNRKGRQSVSCDFLLSRKVKCGYCGSMMNGESGTERNGKRMYYYKCSGRKKHLTDCNKTVIRKDDLENLVINAVISKLKNPKTLKAIVDNMLKAQDEQIQNNSITSMLEKEKRQIETSLNNLVLAIERGIMSETTNQRLHELENRKVEIDRNLLIEE